MKAYMNLNTVPSYGPRIFVPYEYITPTVEKTLNSKCLWGGADKDTGKCQAWEFSSVLTNTILEVIAYLQGYGFTVEHCTNENSNDVWDIRWGMG